MVARKYLHQKEIGNISAFTGRSTNKLITHKSLNIAMDLPQEVHAVAGFFSLLARFVDTAPNQNNGPLKVLYTIRKRPYNNGGKPPTIRRPPMDKQLAAMGREKRRRNLRQNWAQVNHCNWVKGKKR